VLVNLEQLIEKCRNEFDELDYTGDIHLSQDIAGLLQSSLQVIEGHKTTVKVMPFSICLQNQFGLRADLPSSSLWFGYKFWALAKALDDYKAKLDVVKSELQNRFNVEAARIKTYLKNFPSADLRGPDEVLGAYVEQIIAETMEPSDSELFTRFMTDRKWWFKQVHGSEQSSGKTLDRGDVYHSCISLAARVIVANSAKVPNVIYAFANNPELRNSFELLSVVHEDYKRVQEGQPSYHHASSTTELRQAKNIIFYGAPGTGKSYSIAQEVNEQYAIRTVFHPDTQYGDFVGCLKPVMNGDKVGYGFRAGPFIEAVIKATNEPSQHISLVIEEINRAPAAAVFGEIFQLLDRASDGTSTYPISISDPDMLVYLNQHTNNSFAHGRLVIPANLSILATMNSSDQAVMPLDTAFKRRWEFRYLPIDYQKASKGTLEIPTKKSSFSVEWSNFAKVINDTLSIQNIPEDRLLGHRFLSEAELANDAKGALKGKIFMYLWDDVLRHGRKGLIFLDKISTFGDLSRRYEENQQVFNDSIERDLADHSSSVLDADNDTDLDPAVESDGE